MNPLIYSYLQAKLLVNGGRICDSATGPCSCGAWHSESEVDYRIKKAQKRPSLRIVK